MDSKMLHVIIGFIVIVQQAAGDDLGKIAQLTLLVRHCFRRTGYGLFIFTA